VWREYLILKSCKRPRFVSTPVTGQVETPSMPAQLHTTYSQQPFRPPATARWRRQASQLGYLTARPSPDATHRQDRRQFLRTHLSPSCPRGLNGIPRKSWVLIAQPSGDWSRMRIPSWPWQDQLRRKSNKSVGYKWDKYRPDSSVPHPRIRESAWKLEGFTASLPTLLNHSNEIWRPYRRSPKKIIRYSQS
jgi:hypothetical protein